jgi:hypothetical protein
MITTLLAKARAHFGLAPNASLSQLDAAIDADTLPVVPPTDADQGADAGAEKVDVPAAETAPETALTREDVATMIATASAEMSQAISDLNVANAELTQANTALSDRLSAVEGQDAASHTSGKTDAVDLTTPSPIYAQNPANLRAAARLKGLS